ncbi:MAG: hypothetical protein RIC24_01140 [Hyphomicrobiales bacterium]|jgi:hypothetical protein
MASVQEMKDELQSLIDRAEGSDAIMLSGQLGRLDFVSAVLAALAIILVFGGIFGFLEVRYRAKKVAEETARNECREIAKQLLKSHINDELPDEVRKLVEAIDSEVRKGGDYGEQDTN